MGFATNCEIYRHIIVLFYYSSGFMTATQVLMFDFKSDIVPTESLFFFFQLTVFTIKFIMLNKQFSIYG